MAEIGRFFNGVDYGAQDFAEFFSNFLATGYFEGLTVSANNNMTVTVAEGSAFIEGHEYRNTAPLNLTHPAANTTNNRIDRVVVRMDRTPDAVQPLRAMVRAGTPGTNPQAPALIRNDAVYEISLARVLVEAGKSFIESYQITDERNDPAVAGPASRNGYIPFNTKTSSDPVETYNYGYSVMRVNEGYGDFPHSFGILETVRATNITAFQRFTTSGANARVFTRQTLGGVWQSWVQAWDEDSAAVVVESGVNGNGTYIRYSNGIQECFHELQVTPHAGDNTRMTNVWTFPASFISRPAGFSATLADVSGNFTPAKSEISYVGGDSAGSSTSIQAAMYRITGGTNFASGDSAIIKVIAKGRWK